MKGDRSVEERCKHSEMCLQEQGLTLLLDKWQTDSANALWHRALTLESLAKENQQRDTLVPTWSSQRQGRCNSVSKALH